MEKRSILIAMMVLLISVGIVKGDSNNRLAGLAGQDLIRLHIIANSDTREDQALKIQVRDKILHLITPKLLQAKSIADAKDFLAGDLQEIEDTARSEINRWGKEYQVTAQLGEYLFPTRTYGEFSLSAGEYQALRVTIGEGKGSNWWCVLFPPLCFIDITKSVAKRNDQAVPVTAMKDRPSGPEGQVEVRFKTVEVVHQVRQSLRDLIK